MRTMVGIPVAVLLLLASCAGSPQQREVEATTPNILFIFTDDHASHAIGCLLYTSPSPRDRTRSRMPSSA